MPDRKTSEDRDAEGFELVEEDLDGGPLAPSRYASPDELAEGDTHHAVEDTAVPQLRQRPVDGADEPDADSKNPPRSASLYPRSTPHAP